MTRSFRDPAGTCWVTNSKAFRFLDAPGTAQCESFLQTRTARRFISDGKLVETRKVPNAEMAAMFPPPGLEIACANDWTGAVFEHERISFRSYPYEWPPEMLWAAGRLTLDLARESLCEGYCLKDATPYNVLFRGPEPVFIDVPSFESRAAGDPVWQPYAQFVRTVLLPLLANKRWGFSLADIFTTHRDGLQPQDVYPFCGYLECLQPQILSLVSIPTWLRSNAQAKGTKLYEKRDVADPAKARFILESLFGRLRRALDRLQPRRARVSTWSDYMATHSYSDVGFAAKEEFATKALAEFKPRAVLDAGANTGHFSAMAAKAGAEVVAIDLDPACVGSIWQRARAERLNILPLVVDLSRPSPALGWRNAECPSFLERATGRFDCVFMLALIHHLLVTERIPLEEVIALAADLTTSAVVIELVLPQDPMFQQLTRGREHLHRDLDQARFEKVCSTRFEVVNSLKLPGAQRVLYALRRKGSHD